MLNTILIDSDNQSSKLLKTMLSTSYPNVHLRTFSSLIQPPDDIDLVFINTTNLEQCRGGTSFKNMDSSIHIVCLGKAKEDAYRAYELQADCFLLKPYSYQQLEKIFTKLDIKPKPSLVKKTNSSPSSLIGIPTIDGLEYLDINDIILCEGLQKLTRIITKTRTNIISSYHIGKFIHLLKPMGFFSPHKSYLINLVHLKRYCKEGMVFLTNKHQVPVARRRRADFIKQIPSVKS